MCALVPGHTARGYRHDGRRRCCILNKKHTYIKNVIIAKIACYNRNNGHGHDCGVGVGGGGGGTRIAARSGRVGVYRANSGAIAVRVFSLRHASPTTLYTRLTAKDGGGGYCTKKKKKLGPAYRVCSQSGPYGVFS